MERKGLSVVMVCVVIGLVAGQSRALFTDFETCLKTCLVDCAIPPYLPYGACPLRCIVKCIVHHPSLAARNTHQFCTSGCATTLCFKLLSEPNYRIEEVGSCVDGCSQSCTVNYAPTAN